MSTNRWPTVGLGELLEATGESVETPRSASLRFAGVRLHGEGLYQASVVPGAEVKAKSLSRVVPGAFIYNRMWATRGTFAVVPEPTAEMFVTNEYPQFLPKDGAISVEYLALVTQQPSFLDQVDAAAVGSTERRRLHPASFLELKIDLPPLPEQERIVRAVAIPRRLELAWEREAQACLSAFRVARERLLATAGGWARLPRGWVARELGEVAEVKSGITKGRKTKGALSPAPFIRAANVQDGFLDLAEIKSLEVTDRERDRFALAAEDLLLIEGGSAEHVGRGWIWEGQIDGAVCQNHVFRVRSPGEPASQRYLAYAVGASPARSYCADAAKKTTNLASINKSQISEMAIPIPPAEVQLEIVRTLDRLRDAWRSALSSAEVAGRVKRALLDELIGGLPSAIERDA